MKRNKEIDDAMAMLFLQSSAQFGDAVKSFWFYDGDPCPGCRKKVGMFNQKGKALLSLNAFIYRKAGVLIGYFLCGRCARKIHQEARQNPGVETGRHAIIEMHLMNAYHSYLLSLES